MESQETDGAAPVLGPVVLIEWRVVLAALFLFAIAQCRLDELRASGGPALESRFGKEGDMKRDHHQKHDDREDVGQQRRHDS